MLYVDLRNKCHRLCSEGLQMEKPSQYTERKANNAMNTDQNFWYFLYLLCGESLSQTAADFRSPENMNA